jgi:hypothetical protein
VDWDTYYEHIALALGVSPDDNAGRGSWDDGPDLVLDDGGDLLSTLTPWCGVLDRVRSSARAPPPARRGRAGWRPTGPWRSR